MLSEVMQSALNEQIKVEAESSQIYLAMASWAEVKGFEGIATFMFKQSDEERMHMLKLVKYVKPAWRACHNFGTGRAKAGLFFIQGIIPAVV
jgi:ferritin